MTDRCAKCLEPYHAGHICGFTRHDWEAERRSQHKCDTCYAAWHRESKEDA